MHKTTVNPYWDNGMVLLKFDRAQNSTVLATLHSGTDVILVVIARVGASSKGRNRE